MKLRRDVEARDEPALVPSGMMSVTEIHKVLILHILHDLNFSFIPVILL